MFSVLCRRRAVQLGWCGLLGVSILLWSGCTSSVDRVPPSTTTNKPAAKKTAAVEKASPERPKTEVPPEQKPAGKPAGKKEPAKPPTEDTPAVKTPAQQPPAKGNPTGEKPAKPATEEKPAATPPAKEKPAAKPPAKDKPWSDSAALPKKPGPTELPTPVWLNKPVEIPKPDNKDEYVTVQGTVVEVPDSEAKEESQMKPYAEAISGHDVKFDMVPIKGGKFIIGSPAKEKDRSDDEGPQFEAIIEPFWMGKYEVTWDEYELWGLKRDKQIREALKRQPTENDKVADAVAMPTNPYQDMAFGMGKDGYPAICMTQLAAKLYCKWLSAKTGRYYRLPTEAEWEYACRAGTPTAYSFGDDPDALDDYAWHDGNADMKYHKVGKKKPNAWGLYDMHGNVAEWVLDQYVPDFYQQFAGKSVNGPLSPGKTEFGRIVRGGSWVDDPPALRSAVRRASEKKWKEKDPQIPQSIWYLTDGDFVGLRVIRPLRPPTPEEAKKYELDDEQIEEYVDYQKAQAGKQ